MSVVFFAHKTNKRLLSWLVLCLLHLTLTGCDAEILELQPKDENNIQTECGALSEQDIRTLTAPTTNSPGLLLLGVSFDDIPARESDSWDIKPTSPFVSERSDLVLVITPLKKEPGTIKFTYKDGTCKTFQPLLGETPPSIALRPKPGTPCKGNELNEELSFESIRPLPQGLNIDPKKLIVFLPPGTQRSKSPPSVRISNNTLEVEFQLSCDAPKTNSEIKLIIGHPKIEPFIHSRQKPPSP
ncbi:MAG TPA: hypothetical protein DCE42_05340 [Myxococcales bacterium]|nr:hypothetical protein [Deltaproteobacteria bacterium]HAA54156.1 hypothetical protein [Myxococcales bacterium]|tara:strand:+ start:3306 stop:4031 length:726 start_codon:yes stop_codon:yes gene_type:complete